MSGLKGGAVTTNGMLGEFKRGQRRVLGGELNALKTPELGQHLYTWFIDCVQILRGRVDGTFLMRHAYLLKERFLSLGCEPTSLPKLTGAAGKSWFCRWRRRFDVKFMKSVKHLEVSWEKLKTRVRVFLKNVFALRFLWENVFPGSQCDGSAGTRCPRGSTTRRWTALMPRGALLQQYES